MKEIILTQSQIALVDDDQYEFLIQWKWYADKPKTGYTFYAYRNSPTINGKRHRIAMHHEVIGKPPKGFVNDHRNGRGLDNQRHNLRHVTRRQNLQNLKNIKKSSRYPGVCWDKTRKKWNTKITINGKTKNLGLFVNELQAFNAYKQAVENLGEEVIGSN